jgi:hypothetical protein
MATAPNGYDPQRTQASLGSNVTQAAHSLGRPGGTQLLTRSRRTSLASARWGQQTQRAGGPFCLQRWLQDSSPMHPSIPKSKLAKSRLRSEDSVAGYVKLRDEVVANSDYAISSGVGAGGSCCCGCCSWGFCCGCCCCRRRRLLLLLDLLLLLLECRPSLGFPIGAALVRPKELGFPVFTTTNSLASPPRNHHGIITSKNLTDCMYICTFKLSARSA